MVTKFDFDTKKTSANDEHGDILSSDVNLGPDEEVEDAAENAGSIAFVSRDMGGEEGGAYGNEIKRRREKGEVLVVIFAVIGFFEMFMFIKNNLTPTNYE